MRRIMQDMTPGTYEHKLYLSNFLREPVVRRAIHALELPPGSRGLDAGCGIGTPTLWLAEEVGSEGHVTGLDLSPAFLARAEEFALEAGMSGRVSFRKGDVTALPFKNDTFDWLWSMDCAGYLPVEPVSLIRELARVVKPGGVVAITVWSSQKLLPGHPLLEARLNATPPGTAPFKKGARPELHFMRAPLWFERAGLEEVTGRTFVGDIQAPLEGDARSALVSLFEMRWGGAESEMAREDLADYRRLCEPGSPDFVANAPGYYAFFTYTMFSGRVAA